MNSSSKIQNQDRRKVNSMPNKSKNFDSIHNIRHSLAHILAQAVIERFKVDGSVQLGVGPAIENGFYYDFGLPRSVQEDDIVWIEERMKEVIRENVQFNQKDISKEEALRLFKNQPYKLELVELISSGKLNADGDNQDECNQSNVLSVYQHGEFVDLCQGPHVRDSSQINPDAIKLLNVNGAYWRGNEKNPMLSRFYGAAFSSKNELDEHLRLLEAQKANDHRHLGKKLELFHFDESAPGMPYWLPNGLIILNNLVDYWRKEHQKRNYLEFSAPIINDKRIWQQSGHWDHYRDNMFLVPKDENAIYGIKPMNCPNAMVVYNLKLRSYRDLPLRLSDCDVLHRNEKSGTLHGLLRLQKFQQDDAHIFVVPDQIEQEIIDILDIAKSFYDLFNMEYSFRLSGRPQKFVGDVSDWEEAESILESVLLKYAGSEKYNYVAEEGAFYGPKIDIMMKDSLGRSWQMGTIQLDFQLPKRFNCKYISKDGSKKVPVVIHRVIFGSIDRFIGILLEHTKGNLPLWLSPQQVAIFPVADRHLNKCEELKSLLRASEIRASIFSGNARLSKRIREAELMKIPYMVVVGDQEAQSNMLAVRSRSSKSQEILDCNEFVSKVLKEIRELS